MGLCFPALSQNCMLSKSLSLLPKAFQISSAQSILPPLLFFYCRLPPPPPCPSTVSTWCASLVTFLEDLYFTAASKYVAWLSGLSINYPNSKGVNPAQRSEMKIRSWLLRRQSLHGWSSYATHLCDLEKAISGRLNFERGAPFSGTWAGFQAFLSSSPHSPHLPACASLPVPSRRANKPVLNIYLLAACWNCYKGL